MEKAKKKEICIHRYVHLCYAFLLVYPQEEMIDNLTVWIPFWFYSALRMTPHLKTEITVSQITERVNIHEEKWQINTICHHPEITYKLNAPLTAPHVLTVLHLCSSVYFHSYSCYIQIRNSSEVNLHITVTMHVIHDYRSRQGTTFFGAFSFSHFLWNSALRDYTLLDHTYLLPLTHALIIFSPFQVISSSQYHQTITLSSGWALMRLLLMPDCWSM